MGQITINVTDEQLKAVNAVVEDATEWVQAAWDGKANNCVGRILNKYSAMNVSKLDENTKKAELNKLTLKTRKELDAEGNGELNI